MKLRKNDVILFNGDSITDAGRDREDRHSLAGYSAVVAERLEKEHGQLRISCYNRGIGGDTSAKLLERLERDLEEIKPTVFSLLIGINDTWRRFDSNSKTTTAEYAANVRAIFRLVRKYTKRIVVIQPFLLDVDRAKRKFRRDLDPKIRELERIAQRNHAEFVPMDGIFAELCCHERAERYSPDGVHPTELGHEVMAQEWLKRMEF